MVLERRHKGIKQNTPYDSPCDVTKCEIRSGGIRELDFKVVDSIDLFNF